MHLRGIVKVPAAVFPATKLIGASPVAVPYALDAVALMKWRPALNHGGLLSIKETRELKSSSRTLPTTGSSVQVIRCALAQHLPRPDLTAVRS
jgi:hypothetical protein